MASSAGARVASGGGVGPSVGAAVGAFREGSEVRMGSFALGPGLVEGHQVPSGQVPS